MLLLSYPVEPLDVLLFIQNIAEEENNNEEKIYSKTETKPFTQSTYLSHLSPLHSRFAQVTCLERHVKLM